MPRDQLVDVDRLGIERLAAREGQQPVGERRGAVGRAMRAVHEALDVVVPAGAIRRFRMSIDADDAGQHVVEVVRDAAGELADRLHLLRLAQRLFGLAQRLLRFALGGDVAADGLQQAVRGDRAPFDRGACRRRRAQPSSNSAARCRRQGVAARPAAGRPIVGHDELAGRLAPSNSASSQPRSCVQAGLTAVIVPSRPRDQHHVGRQRHIRSRSAVRSATRFSSVWFSRRKRLDRHAPFVDVAQDRGDEDAALALPARRRDLEVARRAVLALRRELDRPARCCAVEDALRRPCPSRPASPSSIAIGWPTSSSARVAELARRRRIGELDGALGVERQDGVRRAVDDGVVAGVLALAQDALAARPRR